MPVPGSPGLSIPAAGGTYYPHPMVPVRRNYCANPCLKNDAAGWGSYIGGATSGPQTRTTTTPYRVGYGVSQLAITGLPNGAACSHYYWPYGELDKFLPVRAGETFYVGFALRTDAALTANLFMMTGAMFLDGTGNYIGELGAQTTAGAQYSNPANGWYWVADAITVPASPAGIAYAVPRNYFQNSSGTPKSFNFWMGGAVISREPLDGYFDGDTPSCWWEGTSHASISGSSPVRGSTNLHPDPHAVNDSAHWGSYGGAPSITTTSFPNTEGRYGGTAAKLTLLDKAAADAQANYDHYGTVHFAYEVPPGRTKSPYTLGCWMKSSRPGVLIGVSGYRIFSEGLYPWVAGYPADSAVNSMTPRKEVTATGDWQWVQCDMLPYTGKMEGTWMHWRAGWMGGGGGLANGDTITFDYMFAADGANTEYFDGASLNATWSTADASFSRQLSAGGSWWDSGASPPSPSKTELRFTRAGFSSTSSRTVENRVTIPRMAAGDLTVPGYLLEQPVRDDFERADQNTPIGTGWSDGTTSLTYKAQVKDRSVRPLAAALDTGAGSFAAAVRTDGMYPPVAFGFRIVSLATTWDFYMELTENGIFTGPTYGRFYELGWWRRPDWDPTPPYANGMSLAWRYDPTSFQVMVPATAVTPDWKVGDEIAVSYDGSSFVGWRKLPGTTSWRRIAQFQNQQLATTRLYPSFWISNYPASTGGGNMIDEFWMARF